MWRWITSRQTDSSLDSTGQVATTQHRARLSQGSHVALLGSLLGLISLALPWLSIRESRLAAGEGIGLVSSVGIPLAFAIVTLWIAALILSLRPLTTRLAHALGVIGTLMLPISLLAAGTGATKVLDTATAMTRASLAGGVWVSLFAAYVLLHTAMSGLPGHSKARRYLFFAGPLAVLVLGISGTFDSLSLMVEFAGNEQRFVQETGRHLALSLGSVTIGACIAIPLGIAAARNARAKRPILLISSAIETIPSLALFGLIIAPLSALSFAYPALREMGIRGVGATPALIALVLYSLLPIIHNTYAGLKQVDPAALDAGEGMGMNRRQISWRIEFPLALPLIGEGVRTAAVQSVGNAAVAALIGAGGLGHFIFQGLGQAAPDLILLGALTVIALALAIDALARSLIQILTPTGLRIERNQ